MHFPGYALFFRLTNARAFAIFLQSLSMEVSQPQIEQPITSYGLLYRDGISSFNERLAKGGSVKIHHRNLQFLAIEMYNVFNGIARAFMSNVFGKHLNADTENISANTRSVTSFYNHHNPNTDSEIWSWDTEINGPENLG